MSIDVVVSSPRAARVTALSLEALTVVGAAAGVQGFLSGSFDPLVDQVHDAWPIVDGRLLPAVALGALVALPQAVALGLGLRPHRRAPEVSLAAGAALTGWVAAQLPLIGWTSPVQWAFAAIGITQTVAAVVWRRRCAGLVPRPC